MRECKRYGQKKYIIYSIRIFSQLYKRAIYCQLENIYKSHNFVFFYLYLYICATEDDTGSRTDKRVVDADVQEEEVSRTCEILCRERKKRGEGYVLPIRFIDRPQVDALIQC